MLKTLEEKHYWTLNIKDSRKLADSHIVKTGMSFSVALLLLLNSHLYCPQSVISKWHRLNKETSGFHLGPPHLL